jgi:outer membrane receptor for ferrienterochelin and colicins
MVSKLFTRTVIVCFFIHSFTVHAVENSRDTEMVQLLALDFETLITVSIASKKEEEIEKAPGIINVVTADEIQRYGARNLRDILNRQTHIQIVGSNLFPHNRTGLRGVTLTHVETDVLLLLNGRPIRDSGNSSANQDIYASFPIETIKQIEIIRGPGSVLYGTNAFAGVINLITKNAPSSPEGSLAFSYGSFDSKKGTLSGGGTFGDLEVYGAVTGIDNEGDDFNHINGEFGTTGKYKTGFNGENILLNAKFKGLTLNALLSDSTTDHGKSILSLPSDDYNLEREFIDIGYIHEFNDDWKGAFNYGYHRYQDDFKLGAFGITQESEGKDYLTEFSLQGKLSENINLLVGATYNVQKNTAKIGDIDLTSRHKNAYLQADYQMTDWLKLIGGVQYNNPDDVDSDYSPRLAAIFKLNEEWNFKLLYGEAFRQATTVERVLNVPGVVVGDFGLSPETIKTFDAQILYSGRRGSFSATYFRSKHEELITRVGVAPQQIVNAGEIEYEGIEIEGKFDVGHGFNFIGNMSYQTSEDDNDNDDMTYAPDLMLKAGVSFESMQGYQFSIFNSYFAASTLQNDEVTTVTANNKDADSYNLLTANVRVNLGQVLNDSTLSNTTFSLYGDNLLDEDIYFPSISRQSVNSLPHNKGRGFYATISVDF